MICDIEINEDHQEMTCILPAQSPSTTRITNATRSSIARRWPACRIGASLLSGSLLSEKASSCPSVAPVESESPERAVGTKVSLLCRAFNRSGSAGSFWSTESSEFNPFKLSACAFAFGLSKYSLCKVDRRMRQHWKSGARIEGSLRSHRPSPFPLSSIIKLDSSPSWWKYS